MILHLPQYIFSKSRISKFHPNLSKIHTCSKFKSKILFQKNIQKCINASTQLKKIIDVSVIRFNVAGAMRHCVSQYENGNMPSRFIKATMIYRQKLHLYKSHLNANSIIMYCIRVPSHATRRGLLLNKVKIA